MIFINFVTHLLPSKFNTRALLLNINTLYTTGEHPLRQLRSIIRKAGVNACFSYVFICKTDQDLKKRLIYA